MAEENENYLEHGNYQSTDGKSAHMTLDRKVWRNAIASTPKVEEVTG